MELNALAGLIETSDGELTAEKGGARTGPFPRHADVEALAREGRDDQLLLLLAAQEIYRLRARVTCWRESGRAATPPLTAADMRLLQGRAHGNGPGERPLPAYITETYRAFCLWYYQAVTGTATRGG
jgi:hypothetical protein